MLSTLVFTEVTSIPHEDVKGKDVMNNVVMNMDVESVEPGGDDLRSMMERYTAYNFWANQQFADWLATASEEDLNLEIESSFSTLKQTILHIWNAEYLWLQTIKDEPADDSPASDFSGTKDDLLNGWLKASENFNNYVKSMSIEDMQNRRQRSRGKGHTVIVDMIHHCMNHSTYHRGQLITMGRQAGLKDPPRTDFIYYISLPAN
jgi:uncharacterized damage-inducible protein DinB